MMTIGEQRHMAVVEAQLRRIADAMETIARAVDGKGENEEQKQKGEPK
jgi:hypothetical protein